MQYANREREKKTPADLRFGIQFFSLAAGVAFDYLKLQKKTICFVRKFSIQLKNENNRPKNSSKKTMPDI